MLPPTSLVAVRIPGAETAPKLQEGEVVMFDEHFYRGFGLPASAFFNNFLTFFSLQPHHLAPNAILQLASFVVLCEGFLGIEPRLDLWQSLFFFKQQSKKMDNVELEKLNGPHPMTPCGTALVHHRTTCGFPQMPLQDFIKQWQRGFFYLFGKLQELTPSAPDVEMSYPSEIEGEGMIETRDAVSKEALESEGSEPYGEHLRPPIVDWTDDDETAPSSYDATFGEGAEEVEEVTSPSLARGRRHAGETAARGEAARNKDKGATTSKPASKRVAPGPPAGG
ncbi:hypothetical protein D1007_07238 [Hordeum vulgare]|nr:hypothetical protein D1007_07238 [Hordeum vulgare]